MSGEFDPYFKWLSIPPEQQPPNHYRLLGVPEFVDDADVIENAADKQTMMLRSLGTGKHAALSQQLLNEVSTAKLTLLDPAQKAAYDTQMRQARAPRGPAPPRTRAAQAVASPMQPAVRAAPASPPVSVRTSSTPTKTTSGQQPKVLIAAGGVVVALLLAIGLYFALSSPKEDPPEVATKAPDAVKLPDATTVTQPPKPRPRPKPEVRPQPKPEPKTKPEAEPPRKSPLVPVAKGGKIDLFNVINLAQDTDSGKWSLTDGELRTEEKSLLELNLPIIVSQYDVTIEVSSTAPERYLCMGLISPIKQKFSAVMNQELAGIGQIEGHPWHANSTNSRPGLPGDGKLHTIVYQVRDTETTVLVDGKVRTQWNRDYSQLTREPLFTVASNQKLCLAANNVVIGKLEFQPLAKDDAVVAAKPPTSQQAVDLLAKIDLEKNTLQGKWVLDQGTLRGVANGSIVEIDHLVQIPEYDVVVDVQNTSPTCHLTLGLVSPLKRQFYLAMGYYNSGLGLYEGKPFHANPTTTSLILPHDGKPHTLIYQVRNEGVTLLLDNEPRLKWRGDYSKLTLPQGFKVSSDQVLYLGSQNVAIKKLEFRPLGAEPKIAKPRPLAPGAVDLLSTLDLDKNPVSKNWKLDDGVLQGTKDTAVFQFDCPMQFAEYDVTMVVKNTDQNYRANMGLVSPRGQQFTVFVEGPSGSSVGAVDGRSHGPNSAHSKRLLPDDGKPHTLVFQVRKKGVEVLLDGDYLLRWHEDIRRLSLNNRYSRLDSQGLFLDAFNIVVERLEYRPLTDSGPMIVVPKILSTGPRTANLHEGNPVPSQEQQQDSLKQVREAFQQEIRKAKTDMLRSDLAMKLLNQSREIRDDLPTRYALLLEALRLAIQAGDSRMAINVATSLEHGFHVPPNSVKVETLKTLTKAVQSDRQRHDLAVQCLDLIVQANHTRQFESIDSVLELAYSNARAIRDGPLLRSIQTQKVHFAEVGRVSLLAEKAMKTLEDQPEHPQANLHAGRFLCFLKNDWPLGLLMLSKGSDKKLKELAEAELANPQESQGIEALGDAWSKYSDSLQGIMQKSAKERAATHYQQALKQLNGLPRAKVDMKLKALSGN